MQVPETPSKIDELELMRLLTKYANGEGAWQPETHVLGSAARSACGKLYAGLMGFADVISPLLDRITARDMETFTMHDRKHALKVAHLMSIAGKL
jgi:hypothetical protein